MAQHGTRQQEPQTPAYVLDSSTLEEFINRFRQALLNHWPNSVLSYSFKTNALPWLLSFMNTQGVWAEVVSDAEYELALSLGYRPERIVFNGPVKSRQRLRQALAQGSVVNLDSKREVSWAAALASIHELDGDGLRPIPTAPPTGDSVLARRAQQEWDDLDRDDPVLLHTDFWCGNALWEGERLTGVVDWSGAGRGPRGVDLAWCRQDLVLLGSPEAADVFLREYERILGRPINDIAAWDVQAAARAHDRVETWLPNYLGIGRTEITATILRERLDEWNARP